MITGLLFLRISSAPLTYFFSKVTSQTFPQHLREMSRGCHIWCRSEGCRDDLGRNMAPSFMQMQGAALGRQLVLMDRTQCCWSDAPKSGFIVWPLANYFTSVPQFLQLQNRIISILFVGERLCLNALKLQGVTQMPSTVGMSDDQGQQNVASHLAFKWRATLCPFPEICLSFFMAISNWLSPSLPGAI